MAVQRCFEEPAGTSFQPGWNDDDDDGDDGDDDDYLHGRWTVFPTLVVRLPTD